MAGLTLAVLVACASLVLADGPPPPPAASSPTATPTPLARVAQDAALPDPETPIPAGAPALAAALEQTTLQLRRAIDAWTASADTRTQEPPDAVTLPALRHQRLIFSLVRRPVTTRRVVALLGDGVRAELRDTLAARVALTRIPRGKVKVRPRLRTGPAEPPGALRSHYEAAERRFGVRWELLAAVNLVETGFNRLRNQSTAGAQGPMQFIPATWRAYGMGGDIRDPRDAIMGAANYLRASGARPKGARSDERRALYHYNQSSDYGSAVLLHARRIARDPRHFLTLYSWQIFVRRDGRLVRLTGPGL